MIINRISGEAAVKLCAILLSWGFLSAFSGCSNDDALRGDLARPIPSEIVETEKLDGIVPPGEALTSRIFRFAGALAEKSLISEVKLTLVGNSKKVNDALFLFHGDVPRYYQEPFGENNSTPSIDLDFRKLHASLVSRNEGILIVQPFCSGKDWHSLFGQTSSDPRADQLALLILDLFRQCRASLNNTNLKLHFHSFSGAGRVDRALHEHLLANDQADGEIKQIVDHSLASWTASDAMVNNSFSDDEKRQLGSVMAHSWARFLHRFSRFPVMFIYDRTGEYDYMQGVHLDVFRFLGDLESSGVISSEPSVELVETPDGLETRNKDGEQVHRELAKRLGTHERLTLRTGEGHVHTFLGKIADAFLELP